MCAAGFLVGGYFGSDVAVGISNDNLRGLFGVFLMIAAALLFRQTRRAPAAQIAGNGEQP
jgi:uncharacterized membrane protein YfcA